MKNFLKIFFPLCLLITFGSCSNFEEDIQANVESAQAKTRALTTSHYYWYNDEPIGINIDENKSVIFFEKARISEFKSAFSAESSTFEEHEVTLSSMLRSDGNILPKQLMWAVVENSDNATVMSDIVYKAPVFTTTDGVEAPLSHLFYVKLKDEGDITKLQELSVKNE